MHEDEIVVDGNIPIRIPDGQYEAVVLSYQRANRFNRPALRFRFKITGLCPHEDVQLDGWVPLKESKTTAGGSKLLRWYMAIVPVGTRLRRIRLKTFKEYLLLVAVETVERNWQQKTLLDAQRYSVVREVVGTVGKIEPAR